MIRLCTVQASYGSHFEGTRRMPSDAFFDLIDRFLARHPRRGMSPEARQQLCSPNQAAETICALVLLWECTPVLSIMLLKML